MLGIVKVTFILEMTYEYVKEFKISLVLWPSTCEAEAEDCHRLEASLGYIARPYPNKLERKKKELKIVKVNARYNLDAGLKHRK